MKALGLPHKRENETVLPSGVAGAFTDRIRKKSLRYDVRNEPLGNEEAETGKLCHCKEGIANHMAMRTQDFWQGYANPSLSYCQGSRIRPITAVNDTKKEINTLTLNPKP